MEYLDLFLIHWPLRISIHEIPVPNEGLHPMDIKSVWEGMEECQNLGLTKAIGVSNFSRKKLEELISIAKIPPAVNQVIKSHSSGKPFRFSLRRRAGNRVGRAGLGRAKSGPGQN